MELRVVTTEKGKILVDESADAKDGELVIQDGGLNRIGIGTHQASIAYTIKPLKIMASINHSISLDVPMVIVEDEIEKMAIDFDKSKFRNFKREHTSTEFYETAIDGIIAGYKASQQKGVYSEEDLIKYLDWIGEMGWYYEKSTSLWVHDDEVGSFKSTEDLVNHYKINSLGEEYIELEMEIIRQNQCVNKCASYPSECLCEMTKQIKTNRVNGQLMAYLKT